MPITSFTCTHELLAQLARFASKSNMSRSAVIRAALSEYLWQFDSANLKRREFNAPLSD
jgi:metal-responsive CopG/Arc/MetJ family transcriptional regulator